MKYLFNSSYFEKILSKIRYNIEKVHEKEVSEAVRSSLTKTLESWNPGCSLTREGRL